MTPLTPRRLNRATLGRQLLLARERLDVVEAVHRVVAIQGQEQASMYVALWDRVVDFDPADLDRAFADGTVIRSSNLRMTIHAVDARDYPAFHEAVGPSLQDSRLTDTRFTTAGVTADEANALLPDLFAFAVEPRTGPEIEAWLDERLAPRPGKPVWWAMRTYAPLLHAPSGGPWSFKQPRRYRTGPDDGKPARSGDPEIAMRHLARRYLEGFGPASIADLAGFAHVYRTRARTALDWLVDGGQAVMLDGPGRAGLYDVPAGLLPPEDTPAPPRLLPMWDDTLLAYDDRSRIIPPDVRQHVIRKNGDVLPTLLVDGYVAGVWRPTEAGIEATAFRPLDDDAWAGLDTEARGMRTFLAQREPLIYHGRFAHWWGKLPEGEVRSLGA